MRLFPLSRVISLNTTSIFIFSVHRFFLLTAALIILMLLTLSRSPLKLVNSLVYHFYRIYMLSLHSTRTSRTFENVNFHNPLNSNTKYNSIFMSRVASLHQSLKGMNFRIKTERQNIGRLRAYRTF